MLLPLPLISTIAKNLVNELDQIDQPFILVLDDYHLIEIQAIHDLLNDLLLHPPRNPHLVLGTRMDPPLSTVTLRANSQVTESAPGTCAAIRKKPCSYFHSTKNCLLIFKSMTQAGI